MSDREVLAVKKRVLGGFSSVLKSGLAIGVKKLEKLEEAFCCTRHPFLYTTSTLYLSISISELQYSRLH